MSVMYGGGCLMLINCINGFYMFQPESINELDIWQRLNNIELVRDGEYFTFKELAEFPNYSFAGWLYGLIPFISNYTGEKSEVMARNKLTFDLSSQSITSVLLATATDIVADYGEGIYKNSPKLPQAYTLTKDLKLMSGFLAFWDYKFNRYAIERFYYESL